MKKAKRRPVQLTEQELHVIAAALGLFQQAMEKSAHLAYGFTTEKQRGRMIEHGLDAIEIRNRLFKEWEPQP